LHSAGSSASSIWNDQRPQKSSRLTIDDWQGILGKDDPVNLDDKGDPVYKVYKDEPVYNLKPSATDYYHKEKEKEKNGWERRTSPFFVESRQLLGL